MENSGRTDRLSECFASDAKVRDEAHDYRGLAAIGEWMAETKKKYSHTMAPLELIERDGKSILKVKLTGPFPGSPLSIEFRFVLANGKIESLEIR